MNSMKLSAGLLLLVSLSACERDMQDLEQYMQTVKAQPPAPIEPIPAIKPYVRFIYPGHEMNPFDSKILAPDKTPEADSGIAPDPNRKPEFLEGFPLDGLRMVGTLNQDKVLWALIRIPDGTIYRAKVGNYLGKNHGKITQVAETKVTLVEIVENGFGGYKERDNSIALSEISNEKNK